MKNSNKFWLIILVLVVIGLQFNSDFFKFEWEVIKFLSICLSTTFVIAFIAVNIFFLWVYFDDNLKCTDKDIVKWLKYFVVVHWIIILPYEFIKRKINQFNTYLDSL